MPVLALVLVVLGVGLVATTVAAELLGIGDRTGAIRPGLEADLIVVERNPLADSRALADVLVVISNGWVALNRLPFGRVSTP